MLVWCFDETILPLPQRKIAIFMEVTHDRLIHLIRDEEYHANICSKDEYGQYIYPDTTSIPSDKETIALHPNLIVLKIQNQTRYLCITHIFPDEIGIEDHFCEQKQKWLQNTTKLPKTLYGEIWDAPIWNDQQTGFTQRYLSSESAKILSKQLLLPSFY